MEYLKELERLHKELNNEFLEKKVERNSLEKQQKQLEDEIASYKLDDLEMINIILQKMAERQRRIAADKMEQLGTCALQYAVSPNYRMKIDITPVKKKPNAMVLICKSNGIETDPDDGNGGGIIDITGLSTRAITLESHDPPIDGPLMYDEPGKMVSKEYVPTLSEFIRKTGKDFERQVILITHNDYLAQMADTKIRVSINEETNESSMVYE